MTVARSRAALRRHAAVNHRAFEVSEREIGGGQNGRHFGEHRSSVIGREKISACRISRTHHDVADRRNANGASR